MRYQYHLLRSHHVPKTKIAVRSKGHKLIGWSVGGPEASLLQKKLQHSNESIWKKKRWGIVQRNVVEIGEFNRKCWGDEQTTWWSVQSNAKKKRIPKCDSWNLSRWSKSNKKISVKVELSSKM